MSIRAKYFAIDNTCWSYTSDQLFVTQKIRCMCLAIGHFHSGHAVRYKIIPNSNLHSLRPYSLPRCFHICIYTRTYVEQDQGVSDIPDTPQSYSFCENLCQTFLLYVRNQSRTNKPMLYLTRLSCFSLSFFQSWARDNSLALRQRQHSNV